MNRSICGADCAKCAMKELCRGCTETNGRPLGKPCFIAEYITLDGEEHFLAFKQTLIDEFNALHIPGMPVIDELHALVGRFVNLEYTLPSGEAVKFLDDNSIYLGNQVECAFGGDRCYGIVAGTGFLLVCSYGKDGAEPELVVYKQR